MVTSAIREGKRGCTGQYPLEVKGNRHPITLVAGWHKNSITVTFEKRQGRPGLKKAWQQRSDHPTDGVSSGVQVVGRDVGNAH